VPGIQFCSKSSNVTPRIIIAPKKLKGWKVLKTWRHYQGSEVIKSFKGNTGVKILMVIERQEAKGTEGFEVNEDFEGTKSTEEIKNN